MGSEHTSKEAKGKENRPRDVQTHDLHTQQDDAQPFALTPNNLLMLQRVAGNRAVGRMVFERSNATNLNRYQDEDAALDDEYAVEDQAPLAEIGTTAAPTVQPKTIQRAISIGGTAIDSAGLSALQDEVADTHLADIVDNTEGNLWFRRSYRRNLIRSTVADMHQASTPFPYATVEDLARDVRQRVLASMYMRQSQGSLRTGGRHGRGRSAFSYPDRRSDGTQGVEARVNEAALAYWGPREDDSEGSYFFRLSAAGLANPYEAIRTLFVEQDDPHKRTLIHCDYVVSVIQYRAWAETIGVQRFREAIAANPTMAPVLKWNGFDDLERPATLPTPGAPGGTVTETPLTEIQLDREEDLIIGDHVRFYNHDTYDLLTEAADEAIWRLENAILIDRQGGENRYQGHGYFAPVTKRQLLGGMLRQYNIHLERAQRLTRAVERARTPAARTAAEDELRDKFPRVERKPTGGWQIAGEGGLSGNPVTRDLVPLTMDWALQNSIFDPDTLKVHAKRAVHTTP